MPSPSENSEVPQEGGPNTASTSQPVPTVPAAGEEGQASPDPAQTGSPQADSSESDASEPRETILGTVSWVDDNTAELLLGLPHWRNNRWLERQLDFKEEDELIERHRAVGFALGSLAGTVAEVARLEQEWPGECLLVTQNIDDLHERAGNRHLLHMHGELLKARCTVCDHAHEWPHDLDVRSQCPNCGRAGAMRVDVVWFGEMPYFMPEIYAALAECDLFISIGTSGAVYPAAGFVEEVRALGRGRTVELNLVPSEVSSYFDDVRVGPATELVPAWVGEMRA